MFGSELGLGEKEIRKIGDISEGNPGSIGAMVQIIGAQKAIDPEMSEETLGAILELDRMGIRGGQIYILFNNKCRNDVRKLLIMLRGVQLGLLSEERLKEMALDQTRQVKLTDEEMEELDRQVCERLPCFAKAA